MEFTQRYRINLAYDGSSYFGWQKQPNQISVQETLENKLSQLFSNKKVDIVGCGRTDTGVHASYYVAHVDLIESINTEDLVYKLNKMLPNSICIFSIQKVTVEFHARFSASARTYHYYIHQNKNPFLPHSHYIPQDLDFEEMNKAAKHLLGTQDFTSLSKLHTDVKTNICTVFSAEWKQKEEQWYFEISANRFLRNMVRATVGTLLDVGLGKISSEEIPKILDQKNRSAAKVSVPACGLFLCNIEY